MGFPDAAEMVATRLVDAAFSFVDDASASEIVGNASSSFINMVPVAVPNTALDGLVKVTEKVSSYSSVVSAKMPTVIV